MILPTNQQALTEATGKPIKPLDDENMPIHSLSITEAQKPGELAAAIQLLSEGISHRKIATATKLSRQTIFKIAENYQDEIGSTLKQQASQKCRKITSLGLDGLYEQVKDTVDGTAEKPIPAGTLSLIICQLMDKQLLLDGEATSRTETVKTKEDYRDIDEIFGKKDKKIIDVTPTKDK